ncbi:MAG TPA: ComEC/Rec2 family competence protein [Gaiellaceae bacterium]|nr:ComEC/Rec2 family competence protein [Gaiellaceae bacterium]
MKIALRSLAPPQVLLGAMCCGLAASNLARLHGPSLAALVIGSPLLAALAFPEHRLLLVAVALAFAGWWLGTARLDSVDRSPLSRWLGTSEQAEVVVTAPPRPSGFAIRAQGELKRFGSHRVSEPVLLELAKGRSPAQGDVLSVLGVLAPPRGPSNGFDERTYLRRHGIHVVVRVDRWRIVGRRGGLGGVADRVRSFVTRGLSQGSGGEQRAVLLGVVLGADEGLSQGLRDRFRASGLYHLLAVSGQNVALVAGGALLVAWLLGVPRLVGEFGALTAIAAYVLAVGAQPSVIRAGISGALGSVAWLLARERDRWWFLLIGAFALLAWNPYTLLDAGFQLSFAAVVAIFTLAPRLGRLLEGYPLPGKVAGFLAISTACGLATAPILWWQFHAVPLLAVPANALAAPAMPPLLGLALAAAIVHPVAPSAAAILTSLAGWCAGYLAFCARLVGGLPFAQTRSGWVAAAIGAGAALTGAYAWRRCRSQS